MRKHAYFFPTAKEISVSSPHRTLHQLLKLMTLTSSVSARKSRGVIVNMSVSILYYVKLLEICKHTGMYMDKNKQTNKQTHTHTHTHKHGHWPTHTTDLAPSLTGCRWRWRWAIVVCIPRRRLRTWQGFTLHLGHHTSFVTVGLKETNVAVLLHQLSDLRRKQRATLTTNYSTGVDWKPQTLCYLCNTCYYSDGTSSGTVCITQCHL